MPTRDKEKLQAYWAVKLAVERGDFPPAGTLVCEECQEALAQDYHHHKGYSQKYRLDVVALCRDCHASETPYTSQRTQRRLETIRKKGGFRHTEEAKLAIGEASRLRKRSEKTRQRTSESIQAWWAKRKGGESAKTEG